MKKKEDNKFKEIILSYWFWVIVAVVSWFIMILMPFDWDKGIWEGTNLYGTIFAYLTQFAWLIAIVLFGKGIIESIQKSKIGDHWKISWTILGIIGIIVYAFYTLSGMGLFDNFSYEYDERILDLDNENEIKIHLGILEEDGYEILSFGYFNFSTEDMKDSGYIKMKSLGNRNNQLWDGLFSLSSVYPNAPEYTIVILEPMQECRYRILGKLYRSHTGTEEVTLKDGTKLDQLEAFQLINYQMDEEGICE